MNAPTFLRAVRAARHAPTSFSSHLVTRSYATRKLIEWEQPEVDPQLGSYPQLPAISYQRRRAKGWDDQQERRNFGEPIPEEQEALSMWSPDVFETSGTQALKEILIASSLFGLLFAGVYTITPEAPALPRSYPHSGLVKELGGLEENKAQSIEEEH